jgi:hypothetical protein
VFTLNRVVKSILAEHRAVPLLVRIRIELDPQHNVAIGGHQVLNGVVSVVQVGHLAENSVEIDQVYQVFIRMNSNIVIIITSLKLKFMKLNPTKLKLHMIYVS